MERPKALMLESVKRFRARQRYQRKKIAKYYHPIRQQCSLADCITLGERHHPDPDKWKEIVWLCRRHHQDEHTRTRIPKPERQCGISGCNTKHHAQGYCASHYHKIIIRGESVGKQSPCNIFKGEHYESRKNIL